MSNTRKDRKKDDTPVTVRIKEFHPDLIQPTSKTYKDPSQGGSKIVVIGKPGCFIKDTPILMYDGTVKAVQDVKVNDIVMGDDSTPRTVLELCRSRDEMFKIIPLYGETYTVNKKHKLVLQDETQNIIEIPVDEYLQQSVDWKLNHRIYRNELKFKEQKITSDPYFTLIENNYKTLPKEMLFNTQEIRLQLLAGVVDNLGHYNVEENFFIVQHINEQFLDQILFLSRSLGYYSMKEKQGPLTYINIHGKNLHHIPSKLYKINPQDPVDDGMISHFSVLPTGVDDYYGFTLDGNHRFLLGSLDVVRNTGKSTLISQLLYWKKDIFPVGMAFSGTEDSNGFYSKMFPETFIYNKYDEKKIENFVRRQKIAKQHIENPWAVLLLDDVNDDNAVFNKQLQKALFMNGRHFKMLYILSLQYSLSIKPIIRTNIDGTFILREPNLRNRKVLWENYAGIIPDFEMFCQMMDQLTNDWCALFILNATRSNRMEDCVYYVNIRPVKNFKFGSPDYYKFHDARFNPSYVKQLY